MSDTPFETCWHCGDTIDARPLPRCQHCPDECDTEGCEELGCTEAAAAPAESEVTEVQWLREALIGEIGAEDYEAMVEHRRVSRLSPEERATIEAEQAAEHEKSHEEHLARWAEYEAQRHPVCEEYPVTVEHRLYVVSMRGAFIGGSEIVSLRVEVRTPSEAHAMAEELRALIGRYSPPGQIAKVEPWVTDRRKQ